MPASTTIWIQWVAATLIANIVIAGLGFPLRLLWGWKEYLNSDLPILLLCGMSAVAVGISQWALLRTRRTITSTYILATLVGYLPLFFLVTVPSNVAIALAAPAIEVQKFGFLGFFAILLFLIIVAAILLGLLQCLAVRSTFSEVRIARWIVATVIGAVCGFAVSFYLPAEALVIDVQRLDYRSSYLKTIVQLFELWFCVAAAQGGSVARLFRTNA